MLRVSPPKVFPVATRSGRPPADAPASADSHRQIGFVLGDEVETLLRALNLEGELADASRRAAFRNQTMASTMATWSRAWLLRLEALHAAEWGNYVAAIALVRSGVDMLAAAADLLQSGAAEWNEWLENGGIAPAHDDHATEFRLHAFRSAETLAADPELGSVYRVASDLAMPGFGATTLLSAQDSTPERVAVTFGDRDFHLGLAELVLGWLLTASSAWIGRLAANDAAPPVDDARLQSLQSDVRRFADRRDRCRIEEVERDGERRYLVHNWRRQPGSAVKRILL